MTFETYCQPFPICPHCGHIHHDSWEWGDQFDRGSTHDCDDCGKEFYALREVTVSWDTHSQADGEVKHE